MEQNIEPANIRNEFCSHAARVMSFKTKKSLPKSSRWPHPSSFALTPEVLASAGYFHDPADNEPDRTTCWTCGESMKGWDEDDDPFTLHLKWSSNCPFARIAVLEHERDTQNPSWSDSPTHSWGPANEWFPRGPVLIESRLATFCGPNGPWKHEGKKGIPTRLELARAGFHFTPNLFKKGRKFDVDDTTSCCYCHRSVTEWEVDDDPVSVHLKKGACIFFTASQPAEMTKKPGAKPARKSSKNPSNMPKASLDPSSNNASLSELPSDTEGKNQSSNPRKKPLHLGTTAPTAGRRPLASSTSERTEATDEPVPIDSKDSIPLKPVRTLRKVAPVSYVPYSPEPVEQSTSKPPVTLAKSSRLSRSTSKATSARTSNGLFNSSTNHRPRTRASSNASSHPEDLIRSTSHQTVDDSPQPQREEEHPASKLKKLKRQKKPATTSHTSHVVDDNPEQNMPFPQTNPRRRMVQDEQKLSAEENVAAPEKTRAPEKLKTRNSQDPGSETNQSPRPRQGPWLRSPESQLISGSEISNRIKGLSPSLFPGFDPKAPQLYPSLLPIAGKSAATTVHKKDDVANEVQEEPVEQALQPNPASLAETENLLQEYLGRQGRGPIADGWLPNPYNPSRPFPPLTAEEAKMPLSEYFPYRANQEEEAFLEWVEEKKMKPWLEAVQNAQELLQSLILTRQSSRKTSSSKKRRKEIRIAAVEKENNYSNARPNGSSSTYHHRQNNNSKTHV